MALSDYNEAAERFGQKLASGFYTADRSTNTEGDYSAEKLERDTQAVEDFAKSELFRELYDSLGEAV